MTLWGIVWGIQRMQNIRSTTGYWSKDGSPSSSAPGAAR